MFDIMSDDAVEFRMELAEGDLDRGDVANAKRHIYSVMEYASTESRERYEERIRAIMARLG